VTELSTGADQYGFNPFPGTGRYPGADAAPGPLSAWKPYLNDTLIAYDYGIQRYLGLRDKAQLQALAGVGIGGTRS
jgi:hypothetical protein